jgi:ABC-type Mn2+/Zn2+ transport system ATPase subunit
MEIQLENVAKKFNKEWIFQHVNLDLSHNDVTAIIGPNGSGKSTLLQVIAGSLLPTDGAITYVLDGHQIQTTNSLKSQVLY